MNKKLLAIGILASAAMLVIGVGSVRSAAGADGGTISGTVYVDSNMNGQRDPGEPPQASRTVNLAVNSDETRIVQSLKTGPDGRYSFTGLAAGENYTVTLASNSGDFCWDDGGYSSPGDETTTDADLWVVEKGPVSVSGTVFDDSNENGVGDPGESGLAGLVVDFRTGAFCVASATTDSRGNYKLAGMPQAVWELDAQWPYAPERTGYWEQTAPLRPYGEYSPLAGLQVPADLDLTGDVGPRSVDVGLHFLAGSGSISLSLFSDLDRDQVRDDNEPPADCLLAIFFRLARRLPSGVVVYLASDIPTCGDGVIEIDGLAPGTYNVGLVSDCDSPNLATPNRWVDVQDGQRLEGLSLATCPVAPEPSSTTEPIPATVAPTPAQAAPASVGAPNTGGGPSTGAGLGERGLVALLAAGATLLAAGITASRREGTSR